MLLRLFLPVIWWSIWLERNNSVFENYVEPFYKVFMRAKDRCFIWACNCKDFLGYSLLYIKANWVDIVKGCEPP